MITPRDAAEADRLAGELADRMGQETHEEELRNERDYPSNAQQINASQFGAYQLTSASAATVVDDSGRMTPTAISSADYARALRRIDELTFCLQRAVNLIQQGLPELAVKVGLRELKKS